MAQKLPQPFKPKHFRVKATNREYFTTNLAMLLKANVPIGEAFEALKQTTKDRKLRAALTQMQHDIDEGMSLWDTLSRSGIVAEQTLALVQLGERSGNLAQNLRVAAAQEEKQRIFRSKLRSALLYPGFVLSLTVVVGIGIAWFLLPNLANTFSQLHAQLPWVTQQLIGFGRFLQNNGTWAVPSFIIGLAVGLYIIFAAQKTKVFGQRLLQQMPGISRLLREVEIARFGYLLGTLLDAGLNITDALNLLQRATTSVPYKQMYVALHASIENGYSFAASFPRIKNAAKLLPLAVQQMIVAGERSGELPGTLKDIGAIYEQKSDATTENLEAILEPVLLVIVALGVLGVAIAVIMPIYGLVSGLGG
jgi:type IV pilus assembly protein PilC